MEKWTQEELEKLYNKIREQLQNNEEFRAAVKKDIGAAVEKLAGRELPQGFRLNLVDAEKDHAGTFTLPNFNGDELNLNDLNAVPGGSGSQSFSLLCLSDQNQCGAFFCFKDQTPDDPSLCTWYGACGAEWTPPSIGGCAAEAPDAPCAVASFDQPPCAVASFDPSFCGADWTPPPLGGCAAKAPDADPPAD